MRAYAPVRTETRYESGPNWTRTTPPAEIYECPDCGALVVARMLHEFWHDSREPSATPMPATMTVNEAARLLVSVIPGDLATEISQGHGLYRLLVEGQALKRTWWNVAKLAHPNRGGDNATWNRLMQAKRVLEEHGGAPT